MQPTHKKTGIALAATAATLFSIAPINVSAGEQTQGKCMGGNSCKGHSFCHTATSACAGQNSCKGQGWIKATQAECEEKGGQYEG